MSPTIDAGDITTELGRDLTQAEAQQVARWIPQTLLIIGKRVADPDTLDETLVEYAVVQMITRRLLRPPDGATQIQTAIDDTSTMRAWSTPAAPGLILDDDLVALLTPDATASNAFTITTMMSAPLTP